jgi:DnaK suppressor protein
MLSNEKKESYKKLLHQRLGEVLAATNGIAAGITTSADQSPDPIDRASTESQTSFAFRIKERDGVLIRKIEHALNKLEDGTFGICEECDEEISEGRLKARPVATLCIKCKEKEETVEKIRESGRRGDRFERV